MRSILLTSQISNPAFPVMRGTTSKSYLDGRVNGYHHNQLNGSLKSMVIDENADMNSSSIAKGNDSKYMHLPRQMTGLGNHPKNKDGRSVSRRKLTQSLDLSRNTSANAHSNHAKENNNHRNQSNTRRGVDESKNQRDITRWSHDQCNYPYHANQRSQFSFELNEFDEEICKRTATRAYATQVSLECDMEVAQCVHHTAIAHDRALFEHAQCVHSHVATAKQIAISEWLKSKSKEEQIQYLSHHDPQSIAVPRKL